jgi:deoxyribodipyrimidine photolyase-related protein
MHGIYHYSDKDYPKSNWFNHDRSLPEFYWDATKTEMNCLGQSLTQIERNGYAHQI